MSTFAYVLLALAIGYVLGRYRATSFQNRGEALVSKVLRSNFGAPEYHLLNHVTLRLKDRTTQVDHILVSRYGVFVIEINDNPNLDAEYEGAVLKDELWRRIIAWFAQRLERRMDGDRPSASTSAPPVAELRAANGA